MSFAIRITAVALLINQQSLHECPVTLPIKGDVEVLGVEWAVPIVENGIFKGYDTILNSVKPTEDSVKVLHVHDTDTQDHYWLVIPDAHTEAEFVALANNCCGSTPSMDAVTIPAVLLPISPCPTVTNTPSYRHQFPLPYNPYALAYKVDLAYFNGAAPATPPAASHANAAAIETWADTNWGAYGAFSRSAGDTVLFLDSPTVTEAILAISLIAGKYCFTHPGTPITVDAIDIGGVVTSFPEITFGETQIDTLINAIQAFLPGTFTKSDDGAIYKLQYEGYSQPVELYYQGAAVASTDFTLGACS